MSIAQASLTVTAGTTYSQYVGSAQTVGAVVVLNESPYGLVVSNGSSSQWIAAQTADLMPCDSPSFNGALQITTDGYLSNANNAPSFLVLFTTYAPGEPIRGSYPAPLVRLIGGTVTTSQATQVINTTSAAPTTVVQAYPSPRNGTQGVSINNDGTFNVSWYSGGTTYIVLGFSGISGLLVSGVQQQVYAPDTLAAGSQETGMCGANNWATALGNLGGACTNFKTVLTNTPTSITLTVSSSSNIEAGFPTTDTLTVYGFNFNIKANAAGNFWWHGTYATNGNCLRAVDTSARTLDHHCDACGHLSTAAPFTACQVVNDGELLSLAYACPACGSVEHFNLTLTAADEADSSPQGTGAYQTTRGAQAALIRALQTALGLPVQP